MPLPPLGLEKFIQRARKAHGDKYVYTSSVYTKMLNKIDIICKVHGPFSQSANNHLQGQGCPKCGKHKKGIKVRYSQNEDATWKPVPGFTNYEASTLGEVRNIHTKHVLSTLLDAEGYLSCHLTSDEGNKKTWKVHRVIALTFLPNPYNLPTVNHINLIRNDNRVENLEWASMKYQIQHRGPLKLQTLRRVLQVDPSTNEIVHMHCDIRDAAEYLISNKLTKTIKQETAMRHLWRAIVKKKLKCNFFWTYEASEEIQNEQWKVFGKVQVSNKGRVKKKDGSITFGTNSNGYKCVTIQGKCVKIHQLVAIVFIPNPNNLPIVNHLDGNKWNNDVSNLVWCTHAENVQHAQDTGLNSGCKRVTLVELNKEFPSIASAARWIQEQTHLEDSTLSKSPLFKRITAGHAGGYTWEVD